MHGKGVEKEMKARSAQDLTGIPPHPTRESGEPRRDDAGAELGICQWFHFQDDRELDLAVTLLHELGVRHLRTGISWADFHRPGGVAWYDRQMAALSEFEVLLSIWHAPPSLTEGGTCNSPPRRLRDFADFVDRIITDYGDQFGPLELWNEPNNRYKWNFETFDPHWAKFGQMIGDAAHWAKECGRQTVLGGMIPVDHQWLNLMKQYGVMHAIDVVAIHAFPGMWWHGPICWEWKSHWHGWAAKVDYIRAHADGRPIWVTETGLATWDLERGCAAREQMQCEALEEASRAPAERVYWYSLIDLDPRREAIEGFHVDENEYHMGLVRHDGSRKDAFYLMQDLLRDPQGAARNRCGR